MEAGLSLSQVRTQEPGVGFEPTPAPHSVLGVRAAGDGLAVRPRGRVTRNGSLSHNGVRTRKWKPDAQWKPEALAKDRSQPCFGCSWRAKAERLIEVPHRCVAPVPANYGITWTIPEPLLPGARPKDILRAIGPCPP